MDEELAITKVRQKLGLIQDEITRAKARLDRLEAEAKKLTTTLEVLENLGEDTVAVTFDGVSTTLPAPWVKLRDLAFMKGVVGVGHVAELLNPSTRQLIVAEFVAGEHLTKNEVVERVKAKDPGVNEGTVATTLSKLTSEGILEKAEGNAYRLKVATPSADDTESGHDLC
ncbi:hypothetical protein [Caballeronia sp. LjRoot31]|uniref:hypothetical protein n=1 Tax=Caballeronia sp. LjRoot31 TaxID=3342324 RepID=UPI003ECDFB95